VGGCGRVGLVVEEEGEGKMAVYEGRIRKGFVDQKEKKNDSRPLIRSKIHNEWMDKISDIEVEYYEINDGCPKITA
jgi:hypothetical protein